MKEIRFLIYLVFILYFVGVFQLFNIGTFGVQPTYPVLLLIYIILFFKFLTNQIRLNTNVISSVKLVVILQLLAGFSYVFVISNNNTNEIQFLKSYGHFLYLTLFSVLMGVFNNSDETWLKVVQIWLIISIILNIFGVYQLFARAFDLPLAWIELTNASLTQTETDTYQQLSLRFSNFYRATSLFSEPSALAGFNLTILGYLIWPMFKAGSFQVFKSTGFIKFIFILSALTLFVTFSLTGVLGLLLLSLAYLIYNRGISVIRIMKIAVAIIAIVLVADVIIESVFETSLIELFSKRLANVIGLTNESMVGESFSTRQNNFNESIAAWVKSPLIGVGLGQMKYIGNVAFSDYGIMHSLVETGIIGGLVFTLIFVVLFADLFLLRNSFHLLDEKSVYLLNCCYYVLIVLFMTNFVTGNAFIGLALWVYIGFAVSIITNAKQKLGFDSKSILFFKKKPQRITKGHK